MSGGRFHTIASCGRMGGIHLDMGYGNALQNSATAGGDRHLQYAIGLVGKQIIGGFDLVKGGGLHLCGH